MTYSVLWTFLPNGISPETGRARFSLVASPRTPVDSKTLGESELMRWPELAQALGTVRVIDAHTNERFDAVLTSDRPDLSLWQTLFPASTPAIANVKTDAPVFTTIEPAYSFKGAVDAITKLYDDALAIDPTEAMTADHPIMQRVAGLQSWLAPGKATDSATKADDVAELMDPARLDSSRLARAAGLLRARGETAAAEMAPIAAVNRRVRMIARKADAASLAAPPPGPAADVPSIAQAEFHQVVSLLLDHPTIALRLGLRFDFEMPAFDGSRVLRAIDAGGRPLNGPTPLPQPWSHVRCDPAAGLFVMETQRDAPGGATEISNGMLDVRPDVQPGKYTVTDVDVLTTAEQLRVMASSIAARQAHPAKPSSAPMALPSRRSAGLTLGQTDRRFGAVAHALARGARFDGQSDGSREIDGAPVLYADDVTSGYRLDVSVDDGPFQSLMRRVATYRFGHDGRDGIVARDEGIVEPISAVQQHDEHDQPHLTVGEELVSWDGWGIGVPRPGPAVITAGKQIGIEQVGAAPIPGYPLTVQIQPEPGSLPKLRYGRSYRFRVRAVDPAGNSIDPQRCDPAMVTPPVVFRRAERVAAPVVVARHAYRPAESLMRMVVTSDGDGHPIGPPSERHLAPPAVPQQTAELHGQFDAAMGPDTPERAAARARLLAIGARQAGTLLDPMVPGPNGTTVPAQGIAVVKTDASSPEPPAQLPWPRGQALPQGQYLIHDTDALRLPYLPDPASDGVALTGAPTASKAPLTAGWGREPWPDAQPLRLVAKAGNTPSAEVQHAPDGRPLIAVTLAPATEITVRISSLLTEDAAIAMDPGARASRAAVRQGQVHLLSESQAITILHAVQKPLQAPSLAIDMASIERPASNGTWVKLRGELSAHRPSSSRIDVEGVWTEVVDRGFGGVRFEPRRAVVGSVVLHDGQGESGSAPFEAMHSFGDVKRRIVHYEPVATTRFTDCFAPAEAGHQRDFQRSGAPVLVDVASTRRPPPPVLHSVLPIFRWLRSVTAGVYQSERRCAGVRVWLKRPWCVTGEGESLGVVVHSSAATAATMQTSSDKDLFTRWGADPYEGVPGHVGNHAPLLANAIANRSATHCPVNMLGTTSDLPSFNYTIAEVPVQFDTQRELWFADIEFDPSAGLGGLNDADWPFVRFGLVRFQAGTLPLTAAATPPHASNVVITDFVQVLPLRSLTARRVSSGHVRIDVATQQRDNRSYFARWQKRMLEPTASPAPAPDLCEDTFTIGGTLATLSVTPDQIHMGGDLNVSVSGSALAELQAGRIVVEESQTGWFIDNPFSGGRVVWRDVFDYSVFDRPDGPV
jgi:hypothetical protein